MENADNPAMPLSGDAYIDFATYNQDKNDSSYNPECQGLTKREHFAAMAMQGLIVSDTPEWAGTPESQAENAVKYADALLKELQK